MSRSLHERVRYISVLTQSWHSIRRNAETSGTVSTKTSAREFGFNLTANLRKIQSRLREGYEFDKSYGATPSKGSGKSGKRPIVVAPLVDRIVQRAILDVLQDADELIEVQRVLSTPTSVGGIKGRGSDTAIALIDDRVRLGDKYIIGSDISGFFTKIKPAFVASFLSAEIKDAQFIQLLERALKVDLKNANCLDPDDRKLFPTDDEGVAQGCPLSALAGNIVLNEFDQMMNDPKRGITCIRYIDDFVLLGGSERNVKRAFDSAKSYLSTLGMGLYDPRTNPDKAFSGKIGDPNVFLGYELIPGEYPPSKKAQNKLLEGVDGIIRDGRRSIDKVLKGRRITSKDRCFAQTIVAIDYFLRGWRGAFRASKSTVVFKSLDRQIEGRISEFENNFRYKAKAHGHTDRRRALGVQTLDR